MKEQSYPRSGGSENHRKSCIFSLAAWQKTRLPGVEIALGSYSKDSDCDSIISMRQFRTNHEDCSPLQFGIFFVLKSAFGGGVVPDLSYMTLYLSKSAYL
jgi:hypothetical protein